MWRKCPKTGFVVTATCSAIAEFNQGVMSTVTRSQEVMGMPSGGRTRMLAAKADSRRLKQSVRQMEASTKEARLARKVARANLRDASSYAPGAF